MEPTKDTALTRFARNRLELHAMISQMTEEEVNSAPVEGEWTTKDLIAHLTSWERVLLDPLKSYRQGGTFQPDQIGDHVAWNIQQSLAWKGHSLEELYESMDDTRLELIEIASQLTDEQWEAVLPIPWGGEGTMAQMISGLAWHEAEHMQSIRTWLQAHPRQEGEAE